MAHVESVRTEEETHGSFGSYTIGFLCSLVLTVIPVVIVMGGWMVGTPKVAVLMTAGILQLVVQLVFFMHLREEKKPRYNLISLILGLLILVVIVAGSVWIMMYNMVAL